MGTGGRPKADLVLSTEERLVLERRANRRKGAYAHRRPRVTPASPAPAPAPSSR